MVAPMSPAERDQLKRVREAYPVTDSAIRQMQNWDPGEDGVFSFWRFVYTDPSGPEAKSLLDWDALGIRCARYGKNDGKLAPWHRESVGDGIQSTFTVMFPLWKATSPAQRQRMADLILGWRKAKNDWPDGRTIKDMAKEHLGLDLARHHYGGPDVDRN